ncbi:LysR family transcriptional regulator [Photobacterium alginatilyticum]|uniref:LysR family transcriptional regulator n=1 Tax=Photobacterium alginatilyticum TaxID=1775171 RepID=A0ABW9YPD5_9GAMM|nr:LysR family transcriptional regulator [Photobacterium alginatilyticum]NBI54904.1 LysR family transcriptional regulator [Photobacterium alginatilyticum]
MNLRQIEVFYAVMKSGTVSGAARQLHVSQPNVTRVLSHTEQQLGFSLFQRIKGRLIPTDEARKLLPEAEKIYQQLGSFHSLTNKIKKGSQHLRVGAPPILATSLLASVVAELCKDSDISVELSTDNRAALCTGLLQNRLDLVICFGNEIPPAISGQELFTEEMVLLYPQNHPYVPLINEGSTRVDWPQLVTASQNIIGLDPRDPLGGILNQSIQHYEPDYHHQITVRSYSAAAQLVEHGAGLAVVDPWTASVFANQLQQKRLDPALRFSVSLLYADHSPISVAGEKFISMLSR